MVRLKRLSVVGCLLITSFITVSQCQSRGRRDISQLEQVVKVLEAQGRLHEVDTDLLQRINTALGRDESSAARESGERRSRSQAPATPTPVSAKQSFLERARQRQLQLLGSRELRGGNRLGSGEVRRKEDCQEHKLDIKRLELENRRLRNKLMDLEEELEMVREECDRIQVPVAARHIASPALDKLDILVQAKAASNPLDLLLAGSKEETEVLAPGLTVSSSLVTPEPVTSTFLSTISTVETLTVTHTTDLVIHYHGRPINTEIQNTEVVTSTLTSTLTSTTEITPSPTWSYTTLTITPTPVLPPPPPTREPEPAIISDLLYQQRLEEERERLALMQRIRALSNPTPVLPSSTGAAVRAEVVEIPRKGLNTANALQKYVEEIRKLKSESTESIRAEPLVSLPQGPTTTVSTVFMSGSRPGEFSTSLVTLTLDSPEPEARVRRHISPSVPEPVVLSVSPETSEQEIVLDSSMLL